MFFVQSGACDFKNGQENPGADKERYGYGKVFLAFRDKQEYKAGVDYHPAQDLKG